MDSKHSPTVLVVEDERPLLTIIQKKLNKFGFETISTKSGEQALDYLKNMDQLPDLIWLDYFLQGMDGLEFMRKVHNDPKFKNIPIYIVSNTAGPDKIKSMLALGAKKYFVKADHKLEEIVKEIKNNLEDS